MSSLKRLYLCICTLRWILLIGSSFQLEILYICVDYEATIKTWQNSFFKSRLPNIKPNMSSFKHLYLCIWTWMGILLNGASVQLGILHIIWGYGLQRYDLAKLILPEPIANLEFRICFLGYELDCYDFAKVMRHEPFVEIYSTIWHLLTIYTLVFCILRGRLLIRSSYLSSSSHLYLCIWTLSGKLRIGSSIQLGILYMFLCYGLEHYDIVLSGQLGTLLINRCVNLPEGTKLQEQVFNLSQGYLACVFYI